MKRLRRRHGRARTGKTVLRTDTYSAVTEGLVSQDHEVDARMSPSGLRTFYMGGKEVAVQLPHGAILPHGSLRRAEQIREVRS